MKLRRRVRGEGLRLKPYSLQTDCLPVLRLRCSCGCRAPLNNLADALKHARGQRHTVTVSGSLSSGAVCHSSVDLREPLLNYPAVELNFYRGCGFSDTFQKAVEHPKKAHKKGGTCSCAKNSCEAEYSSDADFLSRL